MTTMGRRSRLLGITAAAVALSVGATACGGGNTGSGSQPTSAPAASSAPVQNPQAAQTSLITVASGKDFQSTVDGLKQAVSANGMMILGDMDQAGALKTTGLQLKGAHSFFVGNPAAGKMFFQQTPAIGAVIPLQMHVWADDTGKTNISYFDPKPLFQAVDPKLADGGQKMSDAAAMIAKAATGGTGQPGTAQDAKFVTVDAKGSFDDTVNALKQAVSANGMMILGDLDQAGALKATGLQLKGAHTFFAGNPSVGKMFFQQAPAIGAVIPLRILVWADNDGKAHVSYFDPNALFQAVNPKLADGGQKMSQAMTMLANAVK
ncbi:MULTISPECIES: DUF302 domain-containing protein [Pseudonocardiaceae]|nr:MULTISPECIES: DUF302 domain-containing protein [Pseudonocardiaceae]